MINWKFLKSKVQYLFVKMKVNLFEKDHMLVIQIIRIINMGNNLNNFLFIKLKYKY